MRPVIRRSVAWKFFKKTGNVVRCSLCKRDMKFSGNTSNLNNHLRRRHPGYITEYDGNTHMDVKPLVSLMTPSPSQSSSSSMQVAGTSTVAIPRIKRTMRCKNFATDKHPELSESETNSIDDSIIKMIAIDLQPISIVENAGFLEYSQMMQPLYQVPNRKLLSDTMLPAKYSEIRKRLEGILENVNHVAVTTDLWTSDSNSAFLTVTSHFIFQDKMYSAVLETGELPEEYAADNIAAVLSNIFEEWCITTKVVTVISDNGANIKNAIIDNLKNQHQPCVAHKLNLCVDDTIKNVSEVAKLLVKCRSIVSYFRHSTFATEKLRSMQRQLGSNLLELQHEVRTRWNSSLIMLQQMLLVKEPLSAIITSLPNSPEFLSASEWKIISDCIAILKPVETMTTELSAEKYTTRSMIIPLIRGLQYTITNINEETSCGLHFKTTLLDVIKRWLDQLETDRICAITTLLDPRFKKIAFENEANATNARKWLTEEVTYLLNNKSLTLTEMEISDPVSEITTSEPISLWSMLDQKVKTTNNSPGVMANLFVEQYLRGEYLDRTRDPLTFWNTQKAVYPELFQLSQKYLCIPATSVPSERVFSKVGDIINSRRNRIKGEKLNEIIFLNSNYDLSVREEN